jgi:hypothetical protein
MKELFMCLLLNLAQHGKLTEANMYTGGEFSSMKLETENGTYSISISKDKENDGNL